MINIKNKISKVKILILPRCEASILRNVHANILSKSRVFYNAPEINNIIIALEMILIFKKEQFRNYYFSIFRETNESIDNFQTSNFLGRDSYLSLSTKYLFIKIYCL